MRTVSRKEAARASKTGFRLFDGLVIVCPSLQRESWWTIFEFRVYACSQIYLLWFRENRTSPAIDLIFFNLVVICQSFLNFQHHIEHGIQFKRRRMFAKSVNRTRQFSHEEIVICTEFLNY